MTIPEKLVGQIAKKESDLGLRDPNQWEELSQIGESGLRTTVVHVLKKNITLPQQPTIEESTVAMKVFRNSFNKLVRYRLVIGSPGSRQGEVSIFQEDREEEKMASIKGKVHGFRFGPNFTTAEDAYDFIRTSYHCTDASQTESKQYSAEN